MAAAQPAIFSGQDFSLQRDKNRFVLPPQFRKTLKDANGGKAAMLLVKHDRWECLMGFGWSRLSEMEADLDRQEEMAARKNEPFDREKRSLDLYTFEEIPFDGSGRFVLPENLAALAGITDRVFFQGGGKFFTVWSPEELAKADESWKNARATCAALAARETARETSRIKKS